ncbi:hypothetical protein AVEN_165541-1 [Araneus ventricosus]|uniref:Uncharacterized protein n=1 Tax=Araneus ventricosus TaxID=182803 RepID=A0A4Y2A2U2_ARAVE|nr:hypothetical protein AVEN_165541-1 [Araneus ventricosus]
MRFFRSSLTISGVPLVLGHSPSVLKPKLALSRCRLGFRNINLGQEKKQYDCPRINIERSPGRGDIILHPSSYFSLKADINTLIFLLTFFPQILAPRASIRRPYPRYYTIAWLKCFDNTWAPGYVMLQTSTFFQREIISHLTQLMCTRPWHMVELQGKPVLGHNPSILKPKLELSGCRLGFRNRIPREKIEKKRKGIEIVRFPSNHYRTIPIRRLVVTFCSKVE